MIAYALGLLAGQILFKMSARAPANANSLYAKLWAVATSPYFILAMILYLSLSLAWVWILTQIPLSKAYPIVAINFVLTAIAGTVLFDEHLHPMNWLGLILIVIGIALATK